MVTQSTTAPSYHAAESHKVDYFLIYSVILTKYQPYGNSYWEVGQFVMKGSSSSSTKHYLRLDYIPYLSIFLPDSKIYQKHLFL